MKTFEKYLMLISFSLAFLGTIGILPKIFSILLWISVLSYLGIGWRLMSGKSELVPFAIYYLIAQTLVTLIFGINDYPLKKELSYFTSGLLLLSIILIAIYKQGLVNKYPNNQFMIRVVICLLFSFMPLWTDVLNSN